MVFGTLICFLLLLQSPSFGKSIIGEAKYQYGDSESLLEAKDICKTLAIRNALESFAIYVESIMTIKNFTLTKDQIKTTSKAVLTDVVVEESNVEDRIIFIRIRAEIDEKKVLKRLEELSRNKAVDKRDMKVFKSHDFTPEFENRYLRIVSYEITNNGKSANIKIKFKKNLRNYCNLYFDCFDINGEVIESKDILFQYGAVANTYKIYKTWLPSGQKTYSLGNFKLLDHKKLLH